MNNYMLTKTLSMFEWQGLPDTIPQRELEKLLQVNGYAFIAEHEGSVYAFTGGTGGEQDVYGNPTTIVVSNPALGLNKTFNLKTDGVLIRNDDMQLGLLPFYEKQNTILVENDINMMVWGINSRAQNLISAPDDKSKLSAETYLNKLVKGDIGVIGENTMFDGIRVHSTGSSANTNVKMLLEYHQYVKSTLFNEVGLSSNFNMKKERLISSELDQAEDSLFPLVYNMMQNRLDAVERMQEMFNIDVDVDFGSVWFHKNKDLVDGELSDEDSESVPTSDIEIPVQPDRADIEEEGTETETVEEPQEEVEEQEEIEQDETPSDDLEEVGDTEQRDSLPDDETEQQDAAQDDSGDKDADVADDEKEDKEDE